MKKYLLFFVAIVLSHSALMIPGANADVMNPEYLTKKCGSGDREIICGYTIKEPFGPHITDDCKKYENNASYYYLVGHGSSFGGENKYCLKSGAKDNAGQKEREMIDDRNMLMIGVAIIIVVAVSLAAIFFIRRKNVK